MFKSSGETPAVVVSVNILNAFLVIGIGKCLVKKRAWYSFASARAKL